MITDSNSGILLASLEKADNLYCQDYQMFSVSSDQKYFALGCDIWQIPIWDLSAQTLSFTLQGHKPSWGDGFFVTAFACEEFDNA